MSNYRHKSFRRLYGHVIRDLKQIGIDSAARYRDLRDIPTYNEDHERLLEIEIGYASNVASLYKRIEREVQQTDGISIIVDDLVQSLNANQAARALMFSRTTYLLASEVSGHEIGTRENWPWLRCGPEMGTSIDIAFNHLPDVLAGRITPIPDGVHLVDVERLLSNAVDGESIELVENPFMDAEEWAAIPSILQVSLTGEGLGYSNNFLQLGVVLPSLAGLPLETVRKIRADYEPDFVRFQNALKQLAQGLSSVSGMSILPHLMRQTEEEVQKLRKTLEEVRRKHNSLGAYMVLATGLVICLGLFPGIPLKEAVYVMLSGASAAGGLQWLNTPGLPKLEDHPYYFPFRMVDEARKQENFSLTPRPPPKRPTR